MKSGFRRPFGFTLLEILLVLALIGIMVVATVPLISSSGRERQLRTVAEKIEAIVRSQRMKAQTAGRRQVLELRPGGIYEQGRERRQIFAIPHGVSLAVRVPGEKWANPDGQEWEFSPVGLVTPLSVRLQDDTSWMELDFDLLTGRLAEERYAF